MNFKDYVILITGASRGIGRSLAIDCARRGATVIGCARSQEHLKEVLKELKPISPKSAVILCDVADRRQVQTMIGKILTDFGRIDILINNAGMGLRQPFGETPLQTIEEIMSTNYFGAVYCIHAALPSMVARGSGHIVNVSSVAGIIGTLNMAGYCASKFAMNGLSESLYHELKPLGISVSVVCPGPVKTEFNRSFAQVPPISPASLIIPAEAVAKAIIKAIEKRRFEAVLPWWLALACWFRRATPNFFLAAFHRALRNHVITYKKGH